MLVTCDTSPRGPRYPGDDASWDFGQSASFYVDATQEPWRESYRMDTYVTRELPAAVEQHFPVAPGARGIFGHSVGGHGALVLALRNPGLYRSVSALAPMVAPSRVPWGRKAFAAYLGAEPFAWSAYDACDLVRTRPLPVEILIDVGTADKFLETQLQAAAVRIGLRRGRPAADPAPPGRLRPRLLLRLHLRGRPPRPPRPGAQSLSTPDALAVNVAM